MARLGDGPDGDGCHGVITPAIAAYLNDHGPGADREALKADIWARVAEAVWDRSKHSEHYCPSSGDLEHEGLISNGGSGSVWFQSMPRSDDAASDVSRWSFV
jgi:hypothetical protein